MRFDACRSTPTEARDLCVLVDAIKRQPRRRASGAIVGCRYERRVVRVRHRRPRRATAKVPLVQRARAAARARGRE